MTVTSDARDRRTADGPTTCFVSSLQVGLPRHAGGENATASDEPDSAWTSAIWKESVAGPVWCGITNLVGDGQADLLNHGGPEKAVLGYAAAHYPNWRSELGISDMCAGAFGENLTVVGLTEDDVCIGDIVAIGGAVLQLSQPRGPCWKLARRWGVPDLAAITQRTGRTGWYYRVLTEGEIAPGQLITLLDRPLPEWTVARVNAVRFGERDEKSVSKLAEMELLSPTWRQMMARRAGSAPD